jgi:putative MFS transporter
MGFVFTFFDIFDINVSYLQTALAVPFASSVPAAESLLGLPVLLNLVGYIFGALLLSPLSDRFGRRDMLFVTLAITGLGSLFTAFISNYAEFVFARAITGVGIGADLAVVNTYINEVAPSKGRAKYTSLIFFMGTIGALLGLWVGWVLTTASAPFPLGLPFATGGTGGATATDGWRIMYGVGAILAFVGIVLRFELPESPRWLISRGRIEEAEKVVTAMEQRALKSLKELPPVPELIQIPENMGEKRKISYYVIFKNSTYLKRAAVLFFVWFFAYTTLYTMGAGLTTVLGTTTTIPPPEAGMIASIGIVGMMLAALTTLFLGDLIERKYWFGIGAAITLLGGVIMALGGVDLRILSLGAFAIFYGMDVWVGPAYAWSAENFPSRARTSGFALVDGVGHIGGGIGTFVILGLVSYFATKVWIVVALFVVVAAIIAQLGAKTLGKRMDEISP